MDGNGKKRIVLQVARGGAASIAFFDANGKALREVRP